MEQKQQRFDFDTIVVGAGIVGSGCAYKIAKSGRKTLLIEQVHQSVGDSKFQ
jgi:flavin-dependent dehydrogenase